MNNKSTVVAKPSKNVFTLKNLVSLVGKLITIILAGLIIPTGIIGNHFVSVYKNAGNDPDRISTKTLRAINGTLFLVGFGIGFVLYYPVIVIEHLVKQFGDKIVVVLVAIALIVFTIILVVRINAISDASRNPNEVVRRSIIAEKMLYSVMGGAFGIATASVVTLTISLVGSKSIANEIRIVHGFAMFICLALMVQSSMNFYIYDHTGKVWKKGLIASIIIFIMATLVLIGLIALLVFTEGAY